jgi:uncharacterized membrane protein YphA (DoxX/SURF4 family)
MNFSNPLGQSFGIMRVLFALIPILAGFDKFFNYLVDWPKYLAPWAPNLFNQALHTVTPQTVTPQQFMYGVGMVEIMVGVLVALWPAVFAYVVMVWLWGIIANLVSLGHYDIAVRDFGLSIGSLALARLAWAHHLELRGRGVAGVTASERMEARGRAAA